MNKRRTAKVGFTLIELLVVISIIAVLAAMLIANVVGVRERARDAALKSELKQLQTALRLFYNDFGTYPADDDAGRMFACGTSTSLSTCSAGGVFSVTFGSGATAYTTIYMAQLPSDQDGSYHYKQISADSYYIGGTLENEGDGDLADSHTRCEPIISPEAPSLLLYLVCQ